MPTTAHTANWLDTLLVDTVNTGDEIDNYMNQLSKAVRERLIRGGIFIKDADSGGRQGVPFTSPDAYDANEFNVYGKDGSNEPDVADKRLSVTETGGTLAGSWDVGTDLDVGGILKATKSKTVAMPDPGAGDNYTLAYFDEAVTISKVVAVLKGGTTPTATFNLSHGTDRSAAGSDVWTTDKVPSSLTTGDVYTTFDDATIAADSFLWVDVIGVTGAPTELALIIFYKED